jgi:uncharacterized protein YukE
MSYTWDQVQAKLDDPYVSADTKERLLVAYMREHGDEIEDDPQLAAEVNAYTDGTKASYKPWDFDKVMDDKSVDDAMGDANRESKDKGYQAGIQQGKVDDGHTTLDGMQDPVSGGSSAPEKSDDVLAAGRPGLQVFRDFIPVNDKVPGDSVGPAGKFKFEDLDNRYNEQLGISFKKFMEDAQQLRDAHTAVSGLNETFEAELGNIYKGWKGPAANASYDFYSQEISPNSKDLVSFLESAPGTVEEAVTSIFNEVKAKASSVLDLYTPTVGAATPDIAMKVVELANGNIGDEDHDKILAVAAWVDAETGSDLQARVADDSCSLEQENKDYAVQQCKQWIRDSFNPQFHEAIHDTFIQLCEDTKTAVDSYYETLTEALAEYDNKFPADGQMPKLPGDGKPGDDGGDQPGGTGPGGTGPGGTGPGGTGPGGTGPGGQDVPDVKMPGADGPGGPGGQDVGDIGSPGDPNAPSDGTSTSGVDGDYYPPGQEPTGPPKEVTVKDGDRTITVGQPNAQGVSKVTVEDGKGNKKSYNVDFSKPKPGEEREGEEGADGIKGTDDDVIYADENGKAVIKDGDATITLGEVPGDPGHLTMNVDDGTPTDYDLDFDADEPSGQDVGDIPGPDSPGDSGGAGGSTAGAGTGGGGGGGGGGVPGDVGSPGAGGGASGATASPGAMMGAGAQPDGDNNQGGAAPAAAAAGAGRQGGAPMGGMPMGGMGGGQGGGDQQRQSKWRTTGQLFDEEDPAANFSGVVGRDPAAKEVKPKR